jgi:hypothetical protein
MPTELPGNVDPLTVPDLDRLDAMTEAEIFACIRHWQEENYTSVGAQFWIDELSRRRTDTVLRRIAEATAENARLVAQGADQNRTMVKLTVANVIIAAVAVVVSMVALL